MRATMMKYLEPLETYDVVLALKRRGLFFSDILTPTLLAKALRARIDGRSGADAIVCITPKALALAAIYYEFLRAA